MNFSGTEGSSFTVRDASNEIARTIAQILHSRTDEDHSIHDEPILYLSGSPGIGKTFIVREAAERYGFAVYTLIGASLLSEDVGGQPVVKAGKAGTSVAFAPSMIVQEITAMREAEGKPVMLFLDEASRIDTSVQAPLLSFLQFRGIHGHYLPDDTVILMAGNREDDDGGGVALLAPMINRVAVISVEPKPAEWADWTAGSLHMVIEATVRNFPAGKSPFHFDPADAGAPFGSPRSWSAANDYVLFQEEHDLPVDMRRLAAIIGQTNATMVAATAAFTDKLTPVEDILNDPLGVPLHTETAAACMQLMLLGKAPKNRKEVDAAITYALRADKGSTVPKWTMFLGIFAERLMRAVEGTPDPKDKRVRVGRLADPDIRNEKKCQYITLMTKYAVGGAGLMINKRVL